MSVKSLSAAKVVDGMLILSLPDAINPVVWQMELGQTKLSAMELRNADGGTFQLILKTPLHDVQNIATYANRELGIAALLTITKALESAHGQIKSDYNLPAYQLPEWKKESIFLRIFRFLIKMGLWIIGIAVLLFIITFLFTRFAGDKNMVDEISSIPPALQNSQQQNVPVSADDFLEGR